MAPAYDKLTKFRALNPERHGHDTTTKCFVCGDNTAIGVYCIKHEGAFKMAWGTDRWFDELFAHPDFNGNDFDTTICAVCDERIPGGRDYLCQECRKDMYV